MSERTTSHFVKPFSIVLVYYTFILTFFSYVCLYVHSVIYCNFDLWGKGQTWSMLMQTRCLLKTRMHFTWNVMWTCLVMCVLCCHFIIVRQRCYAMPDILINYWLLSLKFEQTVEQCHLRSLLLFLYINISW